MTFRSQGPPPWSLHILRGCCGHAPVFPCPALACLLLICVRSLVCAISCHNSHQGYQGSLSHRISVSWAECVKYYRSERARRGEQISITAAQLQNPTEEHLWSSRSLWSLTWTLAYSLPPFSILPFPLLLLPLSFMLSHTLLVVKKCLPHFGFLGFFCTAEWFQYQDLTFIPSMY